MRSAIAALFPVDPPEKIQDQKAREGERESRKRTPFGRLTGVDRKPSDPGAKRIAGVKRRLREGRAQEASFLCALKHHDLLGTRNEETAPRRHDRGGNRDEGIRGAEKDGEKRDEKDALAHAGEGRIGEAPGEFCAEEIPRDHAGAHDRHDEAHQGRRHARHFLHRGVDVTQIGEKAPVPKEDRRHDKPGAKVREKAKLRAKTRVRKGGEARHEAKNREEHDDARDRRDPEDESPGDGPGEEASERHAHEVGDRHPEHHERDVARGFARLGEFARDDRAHAEVGPVRQARQKARSQHDGVAVGKDRHGVSDDDEAHDEKKQAFERQVSSENNHEHHARADARGVGGDKVAGFRNRDLKIGGDGVQNRHHRKFGDAERKGAER